MPLVLGYTIVHTMPSSGDEENVKKIPKHLTSLQPRILTPTHTHTWSVQVRYVPLDNPATTNTVALWRRGSGRGEENVACDRIVSVLQSEISLATTAVTAHMMWSKHLEGFYSTIRVFTSRVPLYFLVPHTYVRTYKHLCSG